MVRYMKNFKIYIRKISYESDFIFVYNFEQPLCTFDDTDCGWQLYLWRMPNPDIYNFDIFNSTLKIIGVDMV